MNRSTFILVIFISGFFPGVTAQILSNIGADITINNGASIILNGDFENINGSVDNSGSIFITGNWSNTMPAGFLLQGTTGTVTFNGSTLQTIGGPTRTAFHNLTVASNTALSVTCSVGGQLILSGASLALFDNDIILGAQTTISGANTSHYIITNGIGRLNQWVGSSNVYFPVGTISSFLPVRVKNTGIFDQFRVRVFEDVLTYGTVGTTIPEIDHCVNASWIVTETTIGGSDLTVTPYWANANEGSLFDRTNAGAGHYTSGNWDPQPAQAANGSLPHSITRTGITAPSTFAVGDINSPMALILDIVVDLSVFFEGPFNGTDMNTDINGILPLSQPYDDTPWNYAGTENVVAIPNTDIVDWIFVELRDAASAAQATSSTVIARQAGFLLSNGKVVGIDGISKMQFDATFSQNLFVAVFHRNHLEIISANALTKSAGVYTYDFTTDSYQAFGNNFPQKELSSGLFGMYAGDVNSNGNISVTDKNLWSNSAGYNGYLSNDVNLDGEVNNQDKNEMIIPNLGKVSYVPN